MWIRLIFEWWAGTACSAWKERHPHSEEEQPAAIPTQKIFPPQ